MEGKTIAALCILIMLSMPIGQVAAMSEFCACYQPCYTDCRHSLPRFLCVIKCAADCSPGNRKSPRNRKPPRYRMPPAAAGWCKAACSSRAIKICGLSVPPAGAAGEVTCVGDCINKWSLNKA